MELYAKMSLGVLVSFVFATILSPFLIKFATKIKFSQPVYEYVELHKKKSGTATMGGLIFLSAIFIATLLLIKKNNSLVMLCLCVTMGYGTIGFLDDYLKIKSHNNEGGLKPHQKVIYQFLLALVVALYGYKSSFVMGEMYLPFTTKIIDISYFYIPFIIFFFVAVTNSVNLTDGLDGLAGGVTLCYLLSFVVIFIIIIQKSGNMEYLQMEYDNIAVFCAIGIGSILGYLLYNSHPATIFMGDTGSLALGGLLGSLAVVTKTVFYLPFLGIMFVISSVSVIIQVLHYKRTKKRIFLMAPFHHHLEKKMMYETKIVVIYMVVTAITGTASILLTIYLT